MPSVQATFEQFLTAFGSLQLDEMLVHFAADATAFFPVEHQRLRVTGKAAIRDAFAQVLARVRASGATRLPLDATDVQWQILGAIAIVTFHLHGPSASLGQGDYLSRRTFIWQQTADGWRIVHFHGSNTP